MKHSKIFTTLFVCAFLMSNISTAEAQRGRALLSFGQAVVKGLAVKAIVDVTYNAVKEYFNETPPNREAIYVTISNDTNYTVRFQLYDGYNWSTHDLYPNYYIKVQSSYQGAIVIRDATNFYMIGRTGSYDVSEF